MKHGVNPKMHTAATSLLDQLAATFDESVTKSQNHLKETGDVGQHVSPNPLSKVSLSVVA